MRQDHFSGNGGGGFGGHGVAFTFLSPPLYKIWKDVDHALLLPRGEVLDRIYHWDRTPSITNFRLPGHQAQLRQLFGPGVPLERDPEGAPVLLWDMHAALTSPSQAAILKG